MTQPPKHIAPAISLKSFSCPRCGALAHQSWFSAFAAQIKNDGKAELPRLTKPEWVESIKKDNQIPRNDRPKIPKDILDSWAQEATGDVSLNILSDSEYVRYSLRNIHISKCFSCEEISIWRYDTLLYPARKYEVEANRDMDADIQADFNEARAILDLSPRGAAALLRLCIQKLCKQLGKSGKKIDDDIAALVKESLDPKVQQALDIVRVVGNQAVHPGEMDLKDDRETAAKLFGLVNLIADDRITRPKEVEALFTSLPAAKIAAIEKRDGTKKE